jgi:hypothetical protein
VRSPVVLAILAGCGFSAPRGVARDPDAAPPVEDSAPAVDVIAPDVPGMPDAAIDAPPCADDDSDGICNAVDTWQCGPQPAMPGNVVTLDAEQSGDHQTVTLSGTSLGAGKLRTVAPGATFSVSAGYSILDCICTGCIDQIQVGLVPGTRKECVYSANPPCTQSDTGTGSVTLTAPTTPGVYDVRFRVGQDYSCTGMSGNAVGWWTGQAPGVATTVAKICVH